MTSDHLASEPSDEPAGGAPADDVRADGVRADGVPADGVRADGGGPVSPGGLADSGVQHGHIVMPGDGNSAGGSPDAPGAPDLPGAPGADERESVSEPAKVMRVGSMIKQLLDEVRTTPLDGPSRERLREIYARSVAELGTALSDDLREELERLVFPFSPDEVPSDVELRMAQAQLVGWLEGLFHGIQATLFAQQMAARQQLERMRNELPQGAEGGDPRPGTYL